MLIKWQRVSVRHTRMLWAALLVVVLLAGYASFNNANVERASPPTSVHGRASYEPLNTPGQVRYRLGAEQTASATPMLHWKDPVYPVQLLPLHLPPQYLVVRLVIDVHGHVERSLPLLSLTRVDPVYLRTFMAAVRTGT